MTDTRKLRPARASAPSAVAPTAAGTDGGTVTVDAALVGAHQAALWRYLRVLGCSAHAAEDLVQDAFLVLLRARLDDRGPAAVRTWLRGTVRNLFLAACRRDGRSPRALADTDVDAAVAAYERADDGAGYRAALRDCLATLSGDERQLLEQRYRDGRSRAQLAAAADVGAEALKSRLRRIKIRLRHCIQRRLGHGPDADRG